LRALFTLTIFLGSALLFLVQPMIAKMILPTFGGSPQVWNASMVFFQATLLLGYTYAHFTFSKMGTKKQPLLHLVLLAAGLFTLPFALPGGFAPRSDFEPALQVIGVLAIMVGLPFLAVSAGAPLLQRWFAATDDPAAKDPYFLYSASNAGSMLALLAYPFLVEPKMLLAEQSRLWAAGYACLVFLAAASVWSLRTHVLSRPEKVEIAPEPAITTDQKIRWLILAAVPSSLLLGVTSFLTVNVAPVPLLWVAPLSLYLLSFILAFSNKRIASGTTLGRFLPLLIAPLSLAVVLRSDQPIELVAGFHLVTFFLAAWACHRLLVESRPGPGRLTEFYLYLSLGGVLGGAFNAFVAPSVFLTFFEYPLMIAAVAAIMPRRYPEAPRFMPMDAAYPILVGSVALCAELGVQRWAPGDMGQAVRTIITTGIPLILAFLAVDRPLRFGLSILAIFCVAEYISYGMGDRVIHISRNFFGSHIVRRDTSNPSMHTLVHGNTTHGMQNTAPDKSGVALTYYHPTGPVGQVFDEFSGAKKKDRVALVGLGVGSLAAYGQAGQVMNFYEIDPMIEKIARDPRLFTYLSDSKADVNVIIGDARLKLKEAEPNSYGIIVLDAFTSDAIPIHLLTKEAIEMYESKLEPNGVIAVHISNRYLNLLPIVTKTAAAAGLVSIHQGDFMPDVSDMTDNQLKQHREGKTGSEWMILARNYEDFGELEKREPWLRADLMPEAPVWTDDFSNIISAFTIKNPGEE
jgi:hypothetical protein